MCIWADAQLFALNFGTLCVCMCVNVFQYIAFGLLFFVHFDSFNLIFFPASLFFHGVAKLQINILKCMVNTVVIDDEREKSFPIDFYWRFCKRIFQEQSIFHANDRNDHRKWNESCWNFSTIENFEWMENRNSAKRRAITPRLGNENQNLTK